MHASADPRHFPIATLFSLLILLIFWRGQAVNAEVFCGILAGGLLAQWAGTRWARLAKLELKSALVSCLSLMLLLKTNHWGWAMGAAAFAIGSKFLFRAQNRHLFNPTNLGLAAALLSTDQVWLSHGQWGHGPFGSSSPVAPVPSFCFWRAGPMSPWPSSVFGLRCFWAGRLIWAIPGASRPTACKRGAAHLCLLHDFRSKNHARRPSGTHRLCRHRSDHRLRASVPLLQPKRPHLRAGFLVAGHTSDQPLGAGPNFSLAKQRSTASPSFSSKSRTRRSRTMTKTVTAAFAVLSFLVLSPNQAAAFCGFYVAKADASLFNNASQVVLARHDNKTVITMSNDYQGDLTNLPWWCRCPRF